MADFIGGILLKLSDAASPEVYTAVNGLLSLSGFGKTNPLPLSGSNYNNRYAIHQDTSL